MSTHLEMSRLAPLNSLLKATEKQVVVKIINLVFVEISDPSAHSYGGCAPEVQQLLELESMEEASQVKVDSVLTSQIYVTFFYV